MWNVCKGKKVPGTGGRRKNKKDDDVDHRDEGHLSNEKNILPPRVEVATVLLLYTGDVQVKLWLLLFDGTGGSGGGGRDGGK